MRAAPPADRQQLLKNARRLAGLTLQQLAQELRSVAPDVMTHAKGWTGRLLEAALGADAGNLAGPDFTRLGIELKTIPLGGNGKPRESTYVCVAQLEPRALQDWHGSLVRRKLTEVLWIPVEADKTIPIGLRRIGNPILWRPNAAEEAQLRQDWQELCDRIALGELDTISATQGKYLQIRPKAANAQALTRDKNQTGAAGVTLPRGFYLRASFTRAIIAEHSAAGR